MIQQTFKTPPYIENTSFLTIHTRRENSKITTKIKLLSKTKIQLVQSNIHCTIFAGPQFDRKSTSITSCLVNQNIFFFSLN